MLSQCILYSTSKQTLYEVSIYNLNKSNCRFRVNKNLAPKVHFKRDLTWQLTKYVATDTNPVTLDH